MHAYDYAILRLIPDASRGEMVNIGLAVLRPEGPDVRLTPNLAKARALSALIDLDSLRRLPEAIPSALSGIDGREMQLITLRELFQPVTIDEALGRFVARNADEYEARVQETLAHYVMPEPRKDLRRASAAAGRLHHDLREWFKRKGLLAESAEDIGLHKVVSRYPIAPSAGVYAEFALKNGSYRITETVDFRVKEVDSRKSNESAAKAVALIEARAALGPDITRFAIVAARDYAKVQAQINLLSRHAEHVLVRDSSEDMNFYANAVGRAAQMPQLVFDSTEE